MCYINTNIHVLQIWYYSVFNFFNLTLLHEHFTILSKILQRHNFYVYKIFLQKMCFFFFLQFLSVNFPPFFPAI